MAISAKIRREDHHQCVRLSITHFRNNLSIYKQSVNEVEKLRALFHMQYFPTRRRFELKTHIPKEEMMLILDKLASLDFSRDYYFFKEWCNGQHSLPHMSQISAGRAMPYAANSPSYLRIDLLNAQRVQHNARPQRCYDLEDTVIAIKSLLNRNDNRTFAIKTWLDGIKYTELTALKKGNGVSIGDKLITFSECERFLSTIPSTKITT